MSKTVELNPGKFQAFSGKTENGRADFFNREYADYFFSCFGGEQYVKEHYPLVYRAYEESREVSDCLTGESDPDMIPIKTDARPICYHSSGLTKAAVNAVMDEITGEGYLHTKKRLPYVSVTASLYVKDTGEVVDSYALYKENTSVGDDVSKNLHVKTEDIQRYQGITLVSQVESCYITEDGKMHSEIEKSETFVCEGFTDIVKSLELIDPCDKSRKKNDPLIVLYGRGENAGETADYKYPECKETGNKVPIKFPMEGKITFSDVHFPIGYAKGSHTVSIVFCFSTNGTVEYKPSIEECFWVDDNNEHVLHFKFQEDWKNKLDVSDFAVKTELNLRVSFYVRYAIGSKTSGNLRDIPIEISSTKKNYGEYYKASGTHVYIPYVSIRWGCFAKDTWIRMGDGGQKQICDIQKGDILYSPSDGKVRVTGIVAGDEEKLVVIETCEGSRIRVSQTHPMITDQGPRRAAEIRPGTMLVNETGAMETVRFAYLCEYNDKVYNIETEKDDVVLVGNGLQSGGYEMQNAVDAERKEEEPMPLKPEVKALVEEMKRMVEDRFSPI